LRGLAFPKNKPKTKSEMKLTKLAVTLFTGAMALVTFVGPVSAAPLTDQNKQFLNAYEKVHQALVGDDLAGAQKAAAELGPSGADLTKSKSLQEARNAFARLSDEAKTLVAGQPGYYVVYCPMVKKEWVQNSDKVANPYAGKEMISCGEIKR
jgi:hypothetical protein